jgi:hypothetical protein
MRFPQKPEKLADDQGVRERNHGFSRKDQHVARWGYLRVKTVNDASRPSFGLVPQNGGSKFPANDYPKVRRSLPIWMVDYPNRVPVDSFAVV